MSFEKEKDFMIQALEDNYTFNAEHILEEMDNLSMLLSLYYRSKAVSHHIHILKSVLIPFKICEIIACFFVVW